MKILVTGATGYIGSHYVKVAAEHGYDIIGTDFNFNQNDVSRYCSRLIDWDFRKSSQMKMSFDKVVHIGAVGKVPLSIRNPSLYYETNIVGTKNVVDFAECDHFIYCSTGSAFQPEASPYATSKHAGELIVKQFKPKNSIVRFYNVSGNGEFKKFDDEYSHLIRRLAAVANGKFANIVIQGTDYDTRDGTCIRNYTHVIDIVDSLHRVVQNEPTSDLDCLGNPDGYTVKEVIRTMKEVSGVNFEVLEGPRRMGDVVVSTIPYQSQHFHQNHTLENICEDALRHER